MPEQPPSRPVPPLVEPVKLLHNGVVREVSVPPLVAPVRSGSLADIPFHNAADAPAEVVFSRKQPDGRWAHITTTQFAHEVAVTAKGLIASGLRPGDRLAVMARTSYEWTLIDFAGWAAGLVTVPVYPTSSAAQARDILRDAEAVACVVEDVALARMITGIRGALPALEHLWQIDAGAVQQLASAGAHLPDRVVDERRAMLGPSTIATLIYTSGTTGRPKGCVLTHGNFFAGADNCVELLHPVFRSAEDGPASTLLFLPFAHVFGRMVAVGCLRARVRVGHAPSTATEDLLADLAGFRPTFLLAIPHVLEKIYNSGRSAAERMRRAGSFDRAARIAVRWGDAAIDARRGTGRGPGLGTRAAHSIYDPLVYRRIRAALGGRVRHVICGGSPLAKRLCAFYTGAGIQVFEGYGLTETTAAATVTPPMRPRLGTVGWPVPGTGVRIADDGEVLLRGGQVFSGYWDAARRVAVPETDGEGWLATGDLGELDAEGYLTITGRKKDLIITSGGKNTAPAPLEDWLRSYPLISQCLVVGDNRPYLAALITLDPDGLAHWQRMHRKEGLTGAGLTGDPDLLHNIQQAVDETNKLVSQAESIRRFAVLTVDFSEANGYLTPSLKLKRSAITRDFAEEIDRLYR